MGNQKSLVVGATGQVGTQLVHYLQSERGGKAVLPTSRQASGGALAFDLAKLTTPEDVEKALRGAALDAIYCAGGMTYVDGCESEPELAYRANAIGPGLLAGFARRLGVPFVFYSTEYVFSGLEEDPGPYSEASAVGPLNVYGQSKLEGEQRILDCNPDALILRTTVVYGPDAQGKNFIYALMRHVKEGRRMKVPEDQISTPTYSRDLVAATLGLVKAAASGIFHVCGPELLGRLDFARRVASHLGLDGSLLEGVRTSALGQTARRPLVAGLSTDKLTSQYPSLRMRPLAEGIQDCAAELQSDFAYETC